MTNETKLTPDEFCMPCWRPPGGLAPRRKLFAEFDYREQAEALRAVQRFLTPLNIAGQCVNISDKFREALHAIPLDIAQVACEIETKLAEDVEPCK